MTTPITSIPKLMRLDFLTMNFEHVRVGLQLPTYLSLRNDDAVMIIRSRTDGVTGDTAETFALIGENMDDVARGRFNVKKRDGWATSVWRIKPEDVSRLTALQEKVRLSRIEGPRIRGSTAIEILRACIAGILPAGPIYFSTYIKPAENEDYIPMTIDADLVKVFGAAQIATRVSRCEKWPSPERVKTLWRSLETILLRTRLKRGEPIGPRPFWSPRRQRPGRPVLPFVRLFRFCSPASS